MHWFALHTKPRQESIAQDSLVREGIETYYPKLRRKRTIRRKYRWVTGPMFPCYIFARFDVSKNGRMVRYARGVTNIVSFGGKPAEVGDPIIETIAAQCEEGTFTVQPPKLVGGDPVEIQEGPFCGLQGIFERDLSDSERVVILLETIAKGVRVQVSRSQLEKV